MSIRISEIVIDLSSFDEHIHITAALLSLSICLSSSILGSKLLIFKCIRCKLFVLKISHSVVLIFHACKRVLDLKLCHLKVYLLSNKKICIYLLKRRNSKTCILTIQESLMNLLFAFKYSGVKTSIR